MAFFRGQKVTPKQDSPWRVIEFGGATPTWPCPKFREIVTITAISIHYGSTFLDFEEYPGRASFDAECFRPVVDLPACLTELQHIKNHKPIKEPAIGPASFV